MIKMIPFCPANTWQWMLRSDRTMRECITRAMYLPGESVPIIKTALMKVSALGEMGRGSVHCACPEYRADMPSRYILLLTKKTSSLKSNS